MTKIADSYFIDSDTGKRIPVRMEYTGVFKPDTTMITAHNVYRLNNGVAEKLDGSGWRQPNTDDPNYWKTNIRQAAKNQEEPLNSVKYYWNKFTNWIKEDKNGGNMNYASYLQGGGVTPLNAAPLVSKEDIAEIITAALNGTGEIKQQATAALQEMMQDASLAPLVEQVMSEMGIPSLKCGGRVKKKEMGSKLVKAEKAKCGCALKKVGGRLIEVDTCTGLPIHRNGGHILYAKPGDKIPENNISSAAKAYMGAELYDFNFVNPFSSWKEFQRQVGYPVEWTWNGIKKIGEKLDNSEFGKWAMKDYPRAVTPVVKSPTAPKTELEIQQMIQASQAGVRALLQVQQPPVAEPPVAEQPVVENPQKDPVKTWRDTFGAGKSGKFEGLTYDQALARQQEMLNADWFNAQLGNNGLTKRGDDGMWGRTSQNEWTRYQTELQARKDAAAAKQAEGQQLQQLQATSIRRNQSDGMTNEALLGMDAGKAMSTLSKPDYERWMKLNQYQQGRNAALTYNGTRYADEDAYNAAVDAETMRTAPLLNMQDLLNMRGRRKRNAAYTQYQESMDKHVANNPLYSGPKALTAEQLSATSFRNGGRINYANYLN